MIDFSYFDKRLPLILELGFDKSAVARLKDFIELLWVSNEELNLISRKMTFEELIDNHVIDCLLPLTRFPAAAGVIADFGTGGGLPGLIYAIHFSDKKFKLYEKSVLKQAFLKKCLSVAPNIEIVSEIPVGEIAADLVVARAFKPIDVMLDMSRGYYSSGGKYFLLKARKEKIEEELLLAQKKFKAINAKIIELRSPVLEVERHLVLIN